ncbi:MAG: TRAP transporter fused permease subunit [Emcibacteraceae bacterium]
MSDISGFSEKPTWKIINLIIFGLPILLGIVWIMGVPLQLGLHVLDGNYLAILLAFALCASFLYWPYGEKPGIIDILLALISFFVWILCSYNYEYWLLHQHERDIYKFSVAVIAILLLCEGVRKTTGNGMAAVIVTSLIYGLLGHLAGGIFEGSKTDPDRLFIYLYSDGSAVLGFILTVAGTLVLGFLVLGQVMQSSGATSFFSDISMSLIGKRRGGPAKVAIIGSSMMGTVSGSTVANIMSTGMVSIPLMKRHGFSGHMAAGIEAVASNGSQLAPPVMGATAFIIAEYLELPYATIVASAIIPALVYYLFLFAQVDFYARDRGMEGLTDDEIPKMRGVLKQGWIFIIPLFILIFFLFVLVYNPAKSALYSTLSLLILSLIRYRKLPNWDLVYNSIIQLGKPFTLLVMICAGAGIIIGVINMSGIGFNLALALSDIGELYGLFAMLVVTAAIAIILGMGMPTSAVYIVVAMLLAPSIADMGVPLIAAHFFVFYFGLVSMLTPPVAIASYAAAGLANSDFRKTSLAALRLGLSAFIMPFYFVYNPGILLIGSWLQIMIASISLIVAGILLARALTLLTSSAEKAKFHGLIDLIFCLIVGSAPHVLGPENLLNFAVIIAGVGMIIYGNRFLGKHSVKD